MKLRQDARDVVLEAAARDVGHAVDLDLVVHQAGDRLEEAGMDREERVADRLARTRELVVGRHLADVEEHPARERVAVRLEARGGEADHEVPGADGLARDELLAGDRADDRAGEIVLAGGVQTGKLRRLAAR